MRSLEAIEGPGFIGKRFADLEGQRFLIWCPTARALWEGGLGKGALGKSIFQLERGLWNSSH